MLAFRRQLLLPEAALVRTDSAAFLAYTIREENAALIDRLLQTSDPVRPNQRRAVRPGLAALRPFLPLRLIAVLGPARRDQRTWTLALSTGRNVPLAQRWLDPHTEVIESYRGWSLRAPKDAPGYLTWASNRLLWSSDRSTLRSAIDALASDDSARLPPHFTELAGDGSRGAAGAFYLINDGRPFSFSDGENGDTRFQLPAGFDGVGFHFDLTAGAALVGRGRLRFVPGTDLAGQADALRGLLDAAAKQHPGRLRFRIEPAGARALDLTLRWRGLERQLSESLRRVLQPLLAPNGASG